MAFPISAVASESPSLSTEYVGSKGNRVTYLYSVTGGNPDLRYWLVVKIRTDENWLQSGGEFGKIPGNEIKRRLVIGANDLTFPADIFVAGFDQETFTKLQRQTKDDGDWFLADPSVMVDKSFACETDGDGKIVRCDKS
jgi:hypothetical protein